MRDNGQSIQGSGSLSSQTNLYSAWPQTGAKCVLCQEDTDEMLKCPSNSARGTDGAGYRTLAEHLVAFDKIVCLPNTLKLSQLDEGQGIEAAFLLHNATTHADCSTTKQNFRGLKRGKCPTKMIQTPTSSPVRAVDMNIIQQRTANIVRKDMFKMKQDFSGLFDAHCQEESVPVSLLALVSMVLYGPNITAQTSSAFIPQPALTLSQLLLQDPPVPKVEGPNKADFQLMPQAMQKEY
ncbi:hypothetical protein F7725_020165, partial [Dissostichus mawsoni]